MKLIIKTEADRETFIRWVKSISLNDRTFVAEIEPFHDMRSLSQNRLYHAWLRCICQVTGDTPRELHKIFKLNYLPWYNDFESKSDDLSTTNLTTKQFSKYLEEIRQDMINNFDITLPYPGEESWEVFFVSYGRVEK